MIMYWTQLWIMKSGRAIAAKGTGWSLCAHNGLERVRLQFLHEAADPETRRCGIHGEAEDPCGFPHCPCQQRNPGDSLRNNLALGDLVVNRGLWQPKSWPIEKQLEEYLRCPGSGEQLPISIGRFVRDSIEEQGGGVRASFLNRKRPAHGRQWGTSCNGWRGYWHFRPLHRRRDC